MTVRYNKRDAALILGGAAVLALLLVITPHHRDISFYGPLLGVLAATIAGTLMLVRPMFELAEDRIIVFGLIGPLEKQFPFAAKTELRIEDDRVYVGDRALPIKRPRCYPRDWQRFVAATRASCMRRSTRARRRTPASSRTSAAAVMRRTRMRSSS